MILKSLSPKVQEYGFPLEFELNKPNFNGHQLGITVAIVDVETNKVKMDCIPGEQGVPIHNKLMQLLEDKELLIMEEPITQLEDDELRKRVVYKLPYYVEGHSAYMPTINYEQISGAANVTNDLTIEVLFVHPEGWYNRYMTFNVKSVNYTLMDFISDIEMEIEDDCADPNHELGFFIAEDDGEYHQKGDIVLDFYDKGGERYLLGFDRPGAFLDMISSVRLIGLETRVEK